jgi:tripartite-type tricarboxylate transporter receptor subunit TctC
VIRALAIAALVATAARAEGYPSQVVKIVVPFSPGTGMDTIARAVSPKLMERLGQPVVVENKPGASGNIGADAVAKAKPDGYTVLMGANTMLIAAQLYKNVPFDPVRDFAPVSMAAWGTLMLVANPKSGIKSLAELIGRAKASPGAVTYGSPGIGTPHHMAMEAFDQEMQLTMLHVPYKASAGYTQDLLAGEIMVGFLPVHVAAGFVDTGRLVALAVGSSKRHPLLPKVPTIEELGKKRVEVDLWYAFFVPRKTPAPVVTRLNAEIKRVLGMAEVKAVLEKAGLEADASTPEDLSAVVQKDYTRWGSVIKRSNLAVE